MKKIFAFLIAAVILVGAYFALVKSNLIRSIADGVPENVEAYAPENFYYKLLSPSGKKAYDLIMREIYDFPEKILIPDISDEDLDSVYEAILYDNTDVFFLGESCRIKSVNLKTYFYPEYFIGKTEYELQLSELEKAEDKIISSVTTQDEFETELFLHDTLLKTCSYSSSITNESSSPYNCLVKKTASCEGYAKAMRRLLEKCGIECILVVGNVKTDNSTEGHMWNIVKINGKYYHLDATWDDNNNDDSRLTYTYFNISDKLISKNHDILERYIGLCTSNDDNYFVKTNAFFTSYDVIVKNKISALLVNNANNSSKLVSFMFENENDFLRAKHDLFDDEQIYRLLDRANLVTDKKLITDRVYYWNDDSFFVINIFNFYK